MLFSTYAVLVISEKMKEFSKKSFIIWKTWNNIHLLIVDTKTRCIY